MENRVRAQAGCLEIKKEEKGDKEKGDRLLFLGKVAFYSFLLFYQLFLSLMFPLKLERLMRAPPLLITP